MNNIMHDVNGLDVSQRPEDRYLNGTRICKAVGKCGVTTTP
ncbi:MAG: hypothetical protein AB4352_22915 [Hormoscilla sp.]